MCYPCWAMPIRRALSAIFLVITGLSLSGCPFFLPEFEGTAAVTGPLENADVRYLVGEVPLTGAGQTDASGAWSLRAGTLPGPVRVAISGGTLGGTPFDGTISAYIPYYDVTVSPGGLDWHFKNVPVTILSTCVDRYMLLTGMDYLHAVEDVRQYFSIPDEVDALNPDLPPEYFTPGEFLLRAAKHGGFDPYVDQLVADVASGDPVIMKPANGYEIVDVTLGGWLFTEGYRAIGGTAAKFALDKGWGFLAPALGIDTQDAVMREVRDSLQVIKAELAGITSSVATLQTSVDSLMSNVDLTRAMILQDAAQRDLDANIRDINHNYDQLQRLRTTQLPDGSQGPNPAAVELLLSELTQYKPMRQYIYNIGAIMIGTSSQSRGALESLTDLLLLQFNDESASRGNTLLRTYLTLEQYLGENLTYQMQGMVVYANVLNYNHFRSDAGTFLEETMEDLQVDFQAQLNAQVDEFLYQVERLVAASADVRTLLAHKPNMFPDEAKAVFERADVLAHQIASNQPAGFIMHVIGDPLATGHYYRSPYNAPEMGRYEYLSLRGKTVRQIAARIPKSYGEAKYYLSWSRQTSGDNYRYDFEPCTTISFARLSFPSISDDPARWPADSVVRTYTHWAGAKDVVRFQRRNSVNGQTGLAAQEDDFMLGAAVFTGRTTPVLEKRPIEQNERRGDFKTQLTMNPASGYLVADYQLLEKYSQFTTKLSLICDIDRVLQTQIRNRAQSAVKLQVDCSLESIADTDDFDLAATSVHDRWWAQSILDISYDWKLRSSGDTLLGYSGVNWGSHWLWGDHNQSNPIGRTVKRSLDKSATINFSGGQTQMLQHGAFSNRIRTWAGHPDTGRLSDVGSRIQFRHDLKTLELIPLK